ncbi:unnamed protein product [Adineta ricciae]|uniref:Uncharacterized protein n=1 Tax=Adineta ricciae TaxID=249248 RepID=A0A814G924_ADIRI|nr:unnamed protein product [Adineta ricciae]
MCKDELQIHMLFIITGSILNKHTDTKEDNNIYSPCANDQALSNQCSCSCCKGNRCIKQYLGSIQMPTCSATSCKNACKLRHPSKCAGTPGSITATCTKTKAPHRSPVNKIKHKLRPSPKKYIKTPYI